MNAGGAVRRTRAASDVVCHAMVSRILDVCNEVGEEGESG